MSRLPRTKPNLCFRCKQDQPHCRAVRHVVDTDAPEQAATDDPWTKEDMVEAQKNDSDFGVVYTAIQESNAKLDNKSILLWSEQSNVLVHEWQRLNIRDDILYRRWEDPDST